MSTEITADILSFNKKEKIFYAEGFVNIVQGDLKVTADRVKYFIDKKLVHAEGNVKILQNGDYIRCEKVDLNLKDSTGKIDKGEIYIKKRNFRILGDTIEKKKNGRYILKNVTFTSCSRSNPLWAFKCKTAEITPEGLAKAKKIKFKFSFFPYSLLYIPSASFPSKIERSSGFLIPDYNIDGKFGFRYRQGYFWAINSSSDATFYYDLMSKRGVKVGSEYRYFLTERGKGAFKAFFLNDNGMKKNDYSVFEDTTRRYYVNFKHEQEFEKNWRIFTDLHFVSDINYKEDFSEDFESSNFLTKHSSENDNTLNSILFVNKRIKHVNITGDAEYYKDLTKTSNKHTSQKLPEITVFISQNDYAGLKFYTMLDAEYLNIYRKKGDSFSRVILKPTLSKSVSLFNDSFNTETEISPTFSEYFFDFTDKSFGNEDKFFLEISHRGMITISKVIEFPYLGFLKLKHIFEPEYEYRYITDTNRKFERFSHFDYLDDEINQNMLKYGFKQRLLAKYEDGSYNELLFWELYQTWQIDKESYFFHNRRYSNVYSDIRLNFWKYFSLENDFEYDPYDENLYKFALWGKTDFTDKTFLRYEYRYVRDELKQLNFGFNVHFMEAFDFYNYTYYNTMESKLDRLTYGLRYSPECLSVDLSVTQEEDPNNFSINFSLSLNGLGTL
jgi:LPS-assembly protein